MGLRDRVGMMGIEPILALCPLVSEASLSSNCITCRFERHSRVPTPDAGCSDPCLAGRCICQFCQSG